MCGGESRDEVNLLLDILYIHVCVQDDNKVERTFGDSSVRKRYSHIDLLHMIDGVEMQKATVAAGNRCYYMKVCVKYLAVYMCAYHTVLVNLCYHLHVRNVQTISIVTIYKI